MYVHIILKYVYVLSSIYFIKFLTWTCLPCRVSSLATVSGTASYSGLLLSPAATIASSFAARSPSRLVTAASPELDQSDTVI